MTRGGSRGPRRGLTLVEGLVSLLLFSLLCVLAWQIFSSGQRQGKQIEEFSDLLRASTLLERRLQRDLARSLSLGVLSGEGEVVGEEWRDAIEIPLFSSYRGDEEQALRFRSVVYRWDATTRRVSRGGQSILRGTSLSRVSFRWAPGPPVVLEVTLVGIENLRGKPGELVLRLPAPKATESFPHWVLAPHHRAPMREDS